MNPFAMRKQNEGFLPFAQSFEKLIQALLDKDLPKVLRESIVLGEAELQKAEEGRDYIERGNALKAEIDALRKDAEHKHAEAKIVLERSNATEKTLQEHVASEEARLRNWQQKLTDSDAAHNKRHAEQEARHASQTAAAQKLQETQKKTDDANLQRENALSAREAKLAKDKEEFEAYQQKFRERAAAAQAALHG